MSDVTNAQLDAVILAAQKALDAKSIPLSHRMMVKDATGELVCTCGAKGNIRDLTFTHRQDTRL